MNAVLDGTAGEINNKQRHFPGLRKENLPRLFHEFEQLSDSNKRKTGIQVLDSLFPRELWKSTMRKSGPKLVKGRAFI
jgi:hypothetical protein